MDFNLRDFESLNLYSNKNLEKIVGSLVNESSNAVLVNMYEDSLVLLDHTDGTFYMTDYKFSREDLTLEMSNFEKINLTRETVNFQDKVLEFFEDESSIADLTESYKEDVINQDAFLNDLINESMSKKDFSNFVDYSEISEAVASTELESKNEKFFVEYKERLNTHPLTEIKAFNWKDEVLVSLVETENVKLINKSAVVKAKELWKKASFKESFLEASKVFVENVEEGTEKFKVLFEEYPQVFFLSTADRTAMFGKVLIADADLRENTKTISKGMDLLFEKFDLADMKAEYLAEAEGEEVPEGDSPAEPKDAPAEVDTPDMAITIKDLKAVAEKLEDEGAKKKLDAVIKGLEKGLEEGTRPEVVKEAVSILNL